MKKNKLALIVLLLGITSIVNLFGLEKGIIAIIAGCIALREMKNDPSLSGKKFAWVGIVLGAISVITIISLLVWKGPQLIQQLKNLNKLHF